jgi:RluA family pseudouridine synthase
MPAERAKRLFTVASTDPRELGRFLQARLGGSPATVAQLVAEGAVFVGRSRALEPRQALGPGARVTVYTADTPAPPPALQVRLSDADFLVVDKPAGLSTQPGRRGGPSLQALLPPGATLLHRLDAEASGLLLCARTATAAATLQRALERGAITREYLAIVAGRLPESGRIELRIGPRACSGPMSALRQCYPVGSPHGQPATTLFRVAGRRGAGAAEQTLLLVRLLSGRTHQIRVHLAALGSPILGDLAYGEPGPPAPRLMLHAARLRFPHPRTGRPCEILSPPPPELAWPPELVLAEASNAPAAPGASDAPITDAKTSRRDAGTRYSTLAAALDAAFPLAARSPTAAPHLAP